MAAELPRRLIVNADDFGRSESINEAVIRAHRKGILTSASLMVNERACEQAVRLARENPRLGVGLHLSFVCGRSALSPGEIPGLANASGMFARPFLVAGFAYFFQPALREQLRDEMRAQFEKFQTCGLPLDHVDGHLHLHLHPVIFRLLIEVAREFAVRRVRLTFDPLRLNLQLSSGRLAYRLGHAMIFNLLAARARRALRHHDIRHAGAVFGLLQNGLVDESFTLALLSRLPPGNSELYSHPSLDEGKNEFDALVSPRVRDRVRELGIELIRYQDLGPA